MTVPDDHEGLWSFFAKLAAGGDYGDLNNVLYASFKAFISSKDLNAMVALNDVITDFSSELRTLASRRINSLVPIHAKLPFEILSRIFTLAAGRARIDLPLAQVCSHWRQVALNTPALWKRIKTSGLNPHSLEALLERTGGVPFELRMSPREYDYDYDYNYGNSYFLEKQVSLPLWTIIALLGEHIHHVETLSIMCPDPTASTRFLNASRPAPLLQHLCVYRSQCNSLQVTDILSFTPELRSLEYQGGGDWRSYGRNFESNHQIQLPPKLHSLYFHNLATWDLPIYFISCCSPLEKISRIRVVGDGPPAAFSEQDHAAASILLRHVLRRAQAIALHVRMAYRPVNYEASGYRTYRLVAQSLSPPEYSRKVSIPTGHPNLTLASLFAESGLFNSTSVRQLSVEMSIWNEVAEVIASAGRPEEVTHLVLGITEGHIKEHFKKLTQQLMAPCVSVVELRYRAMRPDPWDRYDAVAEGDAEADDGGRDFQFRRVHPIHVLGVPLCKAIVRVLGLTGRKLDVLIVGEGLELVDDYHAVPKLFKAVDHRGPAWL